MSNIETDLRHENIKFQFVSSRVPSAHNGNGLTDQFFRFKDQEDFPIFIIKASRDYIDKNFDPKLLSRFIESVSDAKELYTSIDQGWSNPNRNADLNKLSYQFESYNMTVYYDSSKNIREVKEEALRRLSEI